MGSALQRINVNLPAEARQRLRRLAAVTGRPDAVLARQLLTEAVERAEREQLRKQLVSSRTPERRARELEIAAGLERLG